MSQAPMSPDVTSDDKLWAMLGYVFPIIAIVVLFMEDKKNRPYVKFNAVQSLVATVVLSILATVTFGCGSILFFAMFWWAYPFIRAHNGQALAWGLINMVAGTLLSTFLCGIPSLAIWLIGCYWGWQAYQGQMVTIPVITDFVKNQGWA